MFGLGKEQKIINLMKKIYLSVLSISAICFLNSCYYDNFKEISPKGAIPEPCDSMGVISYSLQIQPIMAAACNQNCHNPTASSGSRDLTDYSQVSGATNDGTASPGDWGSLYGTMSHDPNYGNDMPKGGSKVSDCDLAKIRKWAAAGAPNN
jgi:hypothetical protein